MLDSTMHSLNIRLHASSSQGLSAPPAATTKQDGGLFVTGINRNAPPIIVQPKDAPLYLSFQPQQQQQQQQQVGGGSTGSVAVLGTGSTGPIGVSGGDEMRKIAPPPARYYPP